MNARMLQPGLLLTGAVILSACAMPMRTQDVTCPPNCGLVITLPDAATRSPEVNHEWLYVTGGNAITLDVTGGHRDRRATVLSFDEAAFVDDQGNRLYTIALNGTHALTVHARPRADGVCLAPRGCKYKVINSGTPGRPPLDPWIIID